MTGAAASARRATIGERIVWARKRKGISQEKLAGLIGTSRRHLIRIETGKVARPGDHFLSRIADATEQPLEVFTGVFAEVIDDGEAAHGDPFQGSAGELAGRSARRDGSGGEEVRAA